MDWGWKEEIKMGEARPRYEIGERVMWLWNGDKHIPLAQGWKSTYVTSRISKDGKWFYTVADSRSTKLIGEEWLRDNLERVICELKEKAEIEKGETGV